jgi:glyoxylase-like metal-dependent hydrolase (beta-lactamase superfamily II)
VSFIGTIARAAYRLADRHARGYERREARMDRTLTTLLGNRQKLDGGAMFGNAPRAMWSRWLVPDAENRIDLACRCLLVEEPGRRVLVETGIGAFFDPDLRARYGVVEHRHVLLDALAARGLRDADIDVVVLSHLHFDHAGGLLAAHDAAHPGLRLLFPNATFVVGEAAWDRAVHPHPRDRASFVPGLVEALAATGRVERVRGASSDVLGRGWTLHRSDGHTPGLVLPEMEMPDGPVVFAADLIPGAAWVHAPITMGYDRFPELLVDEKTALLSDLVERRGRLVFTHDPEVACARVARDPAGRFVAVERSGSLERLAA